MFKNLDKLSELTQNCPKFIGKNKYHQSAVLVLFVNHNNKLSIIFEKRASNIRQGNEISFPGGGVDTNDKNCIETALRETEEEIGINRDKIEIISHFGMIINPLGSYINVILGKIKNFNIEDVKLNDQEVQKLHIIPLDYFLNQKPKIYKLQTRIYSIIPETQEILFPAKDLNIPVRYHNSWNGHKLEVYVYIYENETIWGVTAEIIKEISEVLK